MGGASIFVIVVAVGIALLTSLLLFGVAPAWMRSVFLRPNGAWRRFGRFGLLSALAAMLLLAMLVTPQHVA